MICRHRNNKKAWSVEVATQDQDYHRRIYNFLHKHNSTHPPNAAIKRGYLWYIIMEMDRVDLRFFAVNPDITTKKQPQQCLSSKNVCYSS